MGKKRKAITATKPSGPRDYNPKDGKLGPISTFRDVMDDQDQFEEDGDEILFNEGPKTKRQKAEELLDDEDDEILGYSEGSDDDDEDEGEDELRRKQSRKPSKSGKGRKDADSDMEQGQEEAEEHDDGYWGSSRRDYYDADQIETTIDAEEEEKEALRLQKKKLAKMSEADFFNEEEWLGGEAEDADQENIVTEVLKEVEITPDMGTEEKGRLLQARYPELPLLADELLQLQPQLLELQKEAEGQDPKTLAVIKYRILGSLVATLAMYFGILTSPSRDGDGVKKTMDPSELREHEVMGTLLECRNAWKKVEFLKTPKPGKTTDTLPPPPEDEADIPDGDTPAPKLPKETNKAKRAKAKAERKAKAIEDSLVDLDLLLTSKNIPKTRVTAKHNAEDSNSDFGEEDYLDSKTAAEKAARKKSLRFYTSQIAQKANRRAAGGRDAGGDMDIPYRERFRDRQARLNAEAEKRGKKGSNIGADLGGDSDDEDHETAKAIRDEGNEEYYDMIAAASNKRKSEKAARASALASAGSGDRINEIEKVGPDGRREITYAIKANKGLAPKRKKEVRNPRVKKKLAYQSKLKKLKSQKAVYSGGPGKGGYAGEKSGLKTNLVKSVKLS
ncbi:putative sas10 utp3 family protein [Rosellinia necatrix]|uniref:Putative sas10 utp3 family protein n=1 Tax=Rosellinia necatrix TaxID=77044 RepID=A0A1W2TI27_ROSNE|nr:putative sas10 utp3 family protein [Rosellinia necatrix]